MILVLGDVLNLFAGVGELCGILVFMRFGFGVRIVWGL